MRPRCRPDPRAARRPTAASARSLMAVAACSRAMVHSLAAHSSPTPRLGARDQVGHDPLRGPPRLQQAADHVDRAVLVAVADQAQEEVAEPGVVERAWGRRREDRHGRVLDRRSSIANRDAFGTPPPRRLSGVRPGPPGRPSSRCRRALRRATPRRTRAGGPARPPPRRACPWQDESASRSRSSPYCSVPLEPPRASVSPSL